MIKINQDIDLENYTLILSSIGVGNVGQLAVDLLISNLNLSKIGQIFSTAFVPIVGANAYCEDSSELVTTIDIYAGIKERIIVIQVRSPYVYPLPKLFGEITQLIVDRKIAKAIILTSSHDYEERQIAPQHLKLRYIASPKIQSESGSLFSDLNWIKHEPKSTFDASEAETIQIPGGGFARSLFYALSKANISCAVLFKFCSEGDNIPDAVSLLCYLDQWIKVLEISSNNSDSYINSSNLKYPPSWKHLFGKPPPHDLY